MSGLTFQLQTSGYVYAADKVKAYEALGFTFKEHPSDYFKNPMVRINPAKHSPTITFTDLSELMMFIAEWGRVVIITDHPKVSLPILELYDDHRE